MLQFAMFPTVAAQATPVVAIETLVRLQFPVGVNRLDVLFQIAGFHCVEATERAREVGRFAGSFGVDEVLVVFQRRLSTESLPTLVTFKVAIVGVRHEVFLQCVCCGGAVITHGASVDRLVFMQNLLVDVIQMI